MGLGCQMGLNHNVGVKCLEKCCGFLFHVFIYGKKLEDFKQDCKNLRMTTCVQLDGPSPPLSPTPLMHWYTGGLKTGQAYMVYQRITLPAFPRLVFLTVL